uniref:BTB domain-containing protein n=1 Tax=Brassica campestris TaxID=3711 RepID=M4CAD4_BRACM
MVRSEPCVLFAQTFVHPQLDEYVDEVIFAEPVIITACEFLEQNASSSSQAVSLLGATSPPSFALEVFVRCEGESKFKRLCNPFLYTPSAPYPLEVEAVVTNHLVVRGSYRSLSLIVYGNIVKDLGQYNIILEGRSVTDIVNSTEGNLEDLPLVLHSVNRTIEECLSSLDIVSLPLAAVDVPVEVKRLLQLLVKVFDQLATDDVLNKFVDTVVSGVSSYVTDNVDFFLKNKNCTAVASSVDSGIFHDITDKVKKDILDLNEIQESDVPLGSSELLSFLESETNLATSQQLVDMLSPYIQFESDSLCTAFPQLSKGKATLLGLSLAFLLCSGREGCLHFVNSGGMDQLVFLFGHDVQNSTTITLLLLGVVEQATRHAVGCEGFLGWWPREDGSIPSGKSEGYCLLLKLLMQKPCHEVASLAIYILHRLRIYEIVSRYEFAVLSALESLSNSHGAATHNLNMLSDAKSQLQKLQKLMNSLGSVEDPSPSAYAERSLVFDHSEGWLSYKATSKLTASWACPFSNSGTDSHMLSLLKERGFLPLSAALLSIPGLHSELGDILDVFTDIAMFIGNIILSLMFSRTGLSFLLHHSQLTATIIQSLKGSVDLNKEECVPLRYASVLISKGFTCSLLEIGINLEVHLRVVSAVDRLLKSSPQTEEFLGILWELRDVSRSDCGREALLTLGVFPEALAVLIEALNSVKDTDPAVENSGISPLNLAICHSAAEIFEVIVSDSTVSCLHAWIEHAPVLHKALHTLSPGGSNRKDAPSRLLKWIDAGVVYHKHGVVGLLRYAAVLASGGDAQLSSSSILALDLTSAENGVGESSNVSEMNGLDNLEKVILEKSFEGVNLSDSSISQLTTALRILALISDNTTVAAALYDEGAVTVVYAILVNCSFMFERSSNIYDYLVDDDHGCSSISDFLSERNREQSLVDLLIPSLVLLISVLQRLQDSKEQYRNTKLMKALLRLHREVSPKLAACAADLSSHYPDSALGFGAVCHLIVSALVCWPVYGWMPGLFHSLLTGFQTSSVPALGPKETCSFLCILSDILPEEGVWFWKSGMPLLSGLRKLAVGTLMSPQKEKQINWYLEPAPLEKLLNYLTPNLDKIAKIIQHHAVSALVVIQDMLRVFIVRIACQRVEHASILLRPIFASIREGILDESSTRETEAYKVYRYLNFLASLLEHPQSKGLLLEEGIVQLLVEVLQRCYDSTYPSEDRVQEFGIVSESSVIRWCIPVFRSISLLCHSQVPLSCFPKKELLASLSAKDCASIFPFVLKFCQVLPIGNELLSCLCAFKDLVSCSEGQDCLVSLLVHLFSGLENPAYDTNNLSLDQVEMKKNPPFLSCWIKLLNSVNSKDGLSVLAIKAVNVLSVSSIRLCIDGKSLDSKKVAAIKSLFGLPSDFSDTDTFRVENIGLIEQMVTLLSSMTSGSDTSAIAEMKPCLHEVSQSLLSLLKDGNIDDITSIKIALVSTENFDMNDVDSENIEDDFLQRGLEDKFWWECPETLPERLPQSSLSAKRKLPTVESSSRRAKGENSSVDIPTQSSIQRVGSASLPPAPTRRDTFRQRKTNTSRPPSMHVDDYVARERSIDTAGNSNAITISRAGSSSGRPPSVHVDEYMARERRGQNPSTIVVGEATAQVKTPTPARETEKAAGKPKQFKADPDDDLQGIDIVFDGEECEGADDKLPFLQPDENLMQPAPVMVEQNSPHSIVEETESDANGSSQFSHMGTPLASNVDENAQSEYSSRISVSRPEMSLIREPSISSDRKFVEQADETNKMVPLKSEPGFVPGYNNIPGSSGQNLMDPRVGPQGFYSKSSQQQHSGHIQGGFSGRGVYDQKMLPNQPPLPLVPPPSSSHVMQHSSDSLSNQSSPFSRGTPSSGGGPIRHMPPHPSAIPQYSSNPYASLPPRTSTVQTFGYNQGGAGTTEQQQQSGPGIDPQPGTGMTSYPPPNLMQSGYSRPFYGNPMHQGGDKQQQNMLPVPQSLNPHSIPQQLPSMQLQRPMQPPQHVRPPMQISQPSEQGISLQNQYQIPLHPMQMMQQPQVQPYYHPPQQQEISHVQQPQPQQQAVQGQQGAGTSQRQESGMSLHDYLQSPETIQALLSNREKLCELLEQNPKLMQMLQIPFRCSIVIDFINRRLSNLQNIAAEINIKFTGKISAFYSMEPPDDQQAEASYTFGDRSTSDIVVRLRNEEGRDDWIYCHSKILTEKSRYFADRLSDKWPTCKILDSRYCVEVICQESDYDHHINLLRLLYVVSDDVPEDQLCHNVKSALGILCVAKELDCPLIVTACVNYLEAVPWEEGEEEEMLRVVPMIGPEAEPVLARLQPVDPSAVAGIFSSGFRFATSSPPQPLCDIKASAQEQIEYMITEDDDAPLLIADEVIKLEVKECVKSLFARFFQCLEAMDSGKNGLSLKMVVSDLSWAFQILTKMEMVRDFVVTWVDTSEKLVKVVQAMEAAAETVEIRVKVTEVTSKVVEAIGYGTVILPTVKRLQMVKLWLPFVRETKPLVDSAGSNQEEDKEEGVRCKIEGEIWQALESSFVSIILALPSSDQAEILTEWLSKNGVYPDLTEAFEVWCYRSKVAKRRLGLLGGEEDGKDMS